MGNGGGKDVGEDARGKGEGGCQNLENWITRGRVSNISATILHHEENYLKGGVCSRR